MWLWLGLSSELRRITRCACRRNVGNWRHNLVIVVARDVFPAMLMFVLSAYVLAVIVLSCHDGNFCWLFRLYLENWHSPGKFGDVTTEAVTEELRD